LFPIKQQLNYAGENTDDYGTEVNSTPKLHVAHTGDGKDKNCQGQLVPALFAKDHVASPSKNTIRQGAL
jgi:hypothetical protein